MTGHADKTMIGIIQKKNNMGLWLLGQGTALCIGLAVSIAHDWTLGCAAGFAIMVLVDIRGQIGKTISSAGLAPATSLRLKSTVDARDRLEHIVMRCRGRRVWKWVVVRAVLFAVPAVMMAIGSAGEYVMDWLHERLPSACVKDA